MQQNNFTPVLSRIPGLFPGQSGVPGSDSPFGIRVKPRALPIYVDAGHSDANDANDGTNPDAPKLTIASAVAAVTEPGSQIVVMPGAYVEDVVTLATVHYCELIGIGVAGGSPSWASTATGAIALTVNALGWRISGFRFLGAATAACIRLNNVAANVSNFTQVVNNHFYGQVTGLTAIDLVGAPNNILIADNWFDSWTAAAGIAISNTNVATADPLFIKILNNLFQENVEHIDADLDKGAILNNLFENGAVTGTAIDISGGAIGENSVHGNIMPGDYSTAVYAPGTADTWGGNFSDDVAEAEVDASGLTVGVPVA